MSTDLLQRCRDLERARVSFDARGLVAGAVPAGVADSWRRCAPRLPVAGGATVGVDDVAERWEASPIRRAAPDVMEELGRLALGEDWVAAVTDETGHILWSAAGPSMGRVAERSGFVAGSRWDEPTAGTNAPGLALVTGRPETVFAVEHWCRPVHDWVCYAAPVRAPSGKVLGVLDLSSTWRRASPLALTTVTALARVVEHELQGAPEPAGADLALSVLGEPEARLQGRPVHFTLRQLELLTVLAARGSARLEELHDLVYGDRPVSTTTLKAEVSHLRSLLSGAVASRPYRLALTVDLDAAAVLDAVRAGDAGAAMGRYRGQLLPLSDSPYVTDLRQQLDARLRALLLRQGDPDLLLRFAGVHPYDLEVLDRAAGATLPGDPRRAEVDARRLSALR
ncbi:MAG TPA: GAF domain-containing protein [Acidimicrobiales bacterium]|nr:GAF domain-containing protein [Acidimicrobiales bacterium]